MTKERIYILSLTVRAWRVLLHHVWLTLLDSVRHMMTLDINWTSVNLQLFAHTHTQMLGKLRKENLHLIKTSSDVMFIFRQAYRGAKLIL